MSNISDFVKYQRKKLGLSQEELATKAGVGLRFIRELEKGKETLQFNKVNQVLSLFGFQLTAGKSQTDAYEIYRKYVPSKKNVPSKKIYWDYFNKAVKITLRNKVVKYGIIIREIVDKNEIVAWQFVPNNNAREYQQRPDEKLTETILHNDIAEIEDQYPK